MFSGHTLGSCALTVFDCVNNRAMLLFADDVGNTIWRVVGRQAAKR